MNRNPKISNLKSYKKGQCGNPKGRPKKLPGIDALLDKVLGADEAGKSDAEAILVALKNRAKRGDVRAAELLLDRAYGKPKQKTEISGNDGQPIDIDIDYSKLPKEVLIAIANALK